MFYLIPIIYAGLVGTFPCNVWHFGVDLEQLEYSSSRKTINSGYYQHGSNTVSRECSSKFNLLDRMNSKLFPCHLVSWVWVSLQKVLTLFLRILCGTVYYLVFEVFCSSHKTFPNAKWFMFLWPVPLHFIYTRVPCIVFGFTKYSIDGW